MARYTVLRLMIFFGFLCALWLVGLRDVSQRWWLLGLSALGSMVVSYFVLQGPRAQFSASIARRVDERSLRAQKAHAHEVDETAEDTEADQHRAQS
jgi:C4-dicarboxylate-specific signal transduction histidine kinase